MMNVKGILAALIIVAITLPPFGATAAAQSYTLEVSRDPSDGGAYHVEPDQETYEPGTVVTVYALPFPGFEFVGWEGDIAASESELTFAMTADTSLTAVFEVASEVVTEFQLFVVSEPQSAGWVTTEPAKVAYSPDDEVVLTAIPAEGHVFAEWSGDVPDETDLTQPQLQLVVDDNMEITANFEVAATVAGDEPTDTTSGSNQLGAACGALGVLFWPMMMLGLTAIRRRR